MSFLLLIFWQDAKRAKSEQHTAKLERNEKKNDLVSKWNWDLDFQQIYQHKKIEMMKLSGINKRLFFLLWKLKIFLSHLAYKFRKDKGIIIISHIYSSTEKSIQEQ